MRSRRPAKDPGESSSLVRRLAALESEQGRALSFVGPDVHSRVFDFVATYAAADGDGRKVFIDAKPRVRRSRTQEDMRHVDG
ncbi:hypothetical protein ACC862_03510 [Rhizobium ruizarguesonis]